jgi:anthranilate phosphoribosyltransferase
MIVSTRSAQFTRMPSSEQETVSELSFPSALEALLEHRGFSEPQAQAVMEQILQGRLTDAQIAALLVALRIKGETVEELVGFARAMRHHARLTAGELPADGRPIVDTCGTGGDGRGTFNISTAAAFVVAAAGLRVAKHGNRSISSHCGSADVLEALGVHLEQATRCARETLERTGVAFLYAPAVHPAMRHAMRARRELGVRTVFNLLGPLTNPAGATVQIVGVFAARYVAPMAQALLRLGVQRAFVVHGMDGTDEISVSADTVFAEVREGRVRTGQFTPEQFGVARWPVGALAGGDARHNAALLRRVLDGERGALRDAVLVNAAAALVAAGAAPDLAAGAALAARTIDSGAAASTLEAFLKLVSAPPAAS